MALTSSSTTAITSASAMSDPWSVGVTTSKAHSSISLGCTSYNKKIGRVKLSEDTQIQHFMHPTHTESSLSHKKIHSPYSHSLISPSNLKQNGVQEKTPFSESLFMPFHIVPNISLQMLTSKTIAIKASDWNLNNFNQLETDH